MPTEAKLTIAIPVYERTEYFDEALQSALSQKSPVNIIVVDNASSHNYFQTAVENYKSDSVTYYRNLENLGMYGNWNRCIELCQTEYIALLGDDDILNLEYSDFFYKALEKFPDLDFYHTAFERFWDKNIKIDQPYKAPLGVHKGRQLLENAALHGLTLNTNGMLFRTSLYPKYKFEYLKWAYNQDWLFAYSAFASGLGYGEESVLIKIRVNPKGNAVTVGTRAFISTVLVHASIKENLLKYKSFYYRFAAHRERWILRNALISGNMNLVLDMISDKENPFGKHLDILLGKDVLSKLYLNTNGILRKLIVVIFKVKRKLFSFYLKFYNTK